MKHKFSIAIALLTIAVSAHAAIYQCGSVFQGHPCRGAIIRSGAPTTDNDQSGARYSQMVAQAAASRAAREQRQAAQAQAALAVVQADQAHAAATQARHHSNVGQAIPIVGGNGGVVIGIGGGLATGQNGHIYSDGGSSSNPYTRN
jgi:hypothetical protein